MEAIHHCRVMPYGQLFRKETWNPAFFLARANVLQLLFLIAFMANTFKSGERSSVSKGDDAYN
jgi:hypothetical protein